MEEIDIWRSANQLIKTYGDKAAEVAAGKVVEYSKTDDAEGMAVWVQISTHPAGTTGRRRRAGVWIKLRRRAAAA